MLLIWENDYKLRLEKGKMKCRYQELIQWNGASVNKAGKDREVSRAKDEKMTLEQVNKL